MSPRPRSRTVDTATLDLFDERPGGEPPGDDSPGDASLGGKPPGAVPPDTNEVLALLRRWADAGLLRRLDAALASFVAGQDAQAVALMRQTYKPAPDAGGWNPYVDASIALIEKNKPALVSARAALAAVPAPPEANVKDGFFSFTLPSGETMKVAWPPNLDVVDAFVRCFDKPYRDAYGMACRTPGG